MAHLPPPSSSSTTKHPHPHPQPHPHLHLPPTTRQHRPPSGAPANLTQPDFHNLLPVSTASSSASPPPSSHNPRVTRSSARLAAESAPSTTPPEPAPLLNPAPQPSRKRKTPGRQSSSPNLDTDDQSSPLSAPPGKKQKTSELTQSQSTSSLPPTRSSRRKSANDQAVMSNNGSSSKYTDESSKQAQSKSTSRRPSGGNGKKTQPEYSPPSQPASNRRTKKRPSRREQDTAVKEDDDTGEKSSNREKDVSSSPVHSQSDSNDGDDHSAMDEDDIPDPFAAALFGSGRAGHASGLSSTLRALSGMMSGMSSRLRDILTNLRQVDNPTMQMLALEELSNLLLVSNEDNLSGQFSPDPYVKELVALMQPNPITGEENPEMMLLACRCIANLMEALRGSVANVVYGGAVPVLCQKLLDIQYIDVAEQALSTLSKVSIDFPASIVREGGLTACLQFLDFFATGTQRTAVTTAANCCRNIPHDSFPVIRDVMPILLNVLSSHDQKVVEQGCLCVTRVIDSFKRSPEKLEQLVDPPLLRAVLGLLLPGTTNLIGANIHTEFLRVLGIVARASPRLAAELLKMNVVDTLYQILTGVSPPSDTSDAASKIDSVVIMQALIHRPREQIYETLNVICQLLPPPQINRDLDHELYEDLDEGMSDEVDESSGEPVSRTTKRLDLLQGCKVETRRFAMILMPTLTDAYSSTVNLNVRKKVLIAHLKILSNLEISVIEEALRPVPYASFLASILSQEDHPSLVVFALEASELLFERLEDIYQYQFHREGVIGEIKKLANRPLGRFESTSPATDLVRSETNRSGQEGDDLALGQPKPSISSRHRNAEREAEEEEEEDGLDDDIEVDEDDDPDNEEHNPEDDEDEIEDEIDDGHVHDLDDSQSSDSSSEDDALPSPLAIAGIADLVVLRAKKFLEKHDTKKGREFKEKARLIREGLLKLAEDIETFYHSSTDAEAGGPLFTRLAGYFDGDALESITSSELLDSGIIRTLLQVLSDGADKVSTAARADFVTAFMESTNQSNIKTSSSTPTHFSVLIQKLQDLLSRAEHFEVLTVNNNASENSRSSSTSMLSRQIRLRLSADGDSDIPPTYREMIVSIHAIATFKALDDYLRPRFIPSDRPASAQRRRDMLQQIANARLAHLAGAAESGLLSPFGQDLGAPATPPPGSRSASRLSSRNKQRSQETPPLEKKPDETPERKRSTRRTQASATDVPPAPAPEPSTEVSGDKLECADEKTLEDDNMPEGETDGALEAFVDGLEEDVSDDDSPEPGAVNMEIGTSGKVTARKEDGTRVFTPQPGTPVAAGTRPPSSGQSPGVSPAPLASTSSGGRQPYAAALSSVPQDWHVEFSIDGKIIPNNTTIYRAVHHNRDQPQDPTARSVWAGVHTIKFKKVRGPPPKTSNFAIGDESVKPESRDGLPASLDGHPVTSSILSLLRILHELNANLDEVRENIGRSDLTLYDEPLASFINTKLTAKMNRQLEEPLIVASNCLPDWSEDLARTFPFLFPFETRHLFLQCTSFGYSRSMIRWQNTQSESDDRRDRRRDERPMLGRPQRQKVRISRTRILESAMKVMDMYGASPSVLEVEYFEEVGTGLGPTLEFYSSVSKEFSKKKLKMWRENDSADKDQFAFGKNGLFPAPMSEAEAQTEAGKKLLLLFKGLGKFVARSMLDSRIIDVSFNATFFKVGSFSLKPTIGLLRSVDQDLANSLSHFQQYVKAKVKIELDASMTKAEKTQAIANLTIQGARVEDLMLDFTLPGYPHVELLENGDETPVTSDNVQEYVEKVLDLSLNTGVRRQIEAFQSGFSQVFAFSTLTAFTPNELVMLFGRIDEDWSIETLTDSVKADHGYNMDSKSVKNLLNSMSELTQSERRDFLQFVTGSPKLPIGGFKSLTPMFTVVCKPSEPPYSSDDYLPSVMTCVNYLKLPDYTSEEVLKERLFVAIREGQGSFHLS